MEGKTVGVPWFRKEDYPKLLLLLPDASYLPRTYEEWMVEASSFCESLNRDGVGTIKIVIDLDNFPFWCARQNKKLDVSARRDFAHEMATREFRQSN